MTQTKPVALVTGASRGIGRAIAIKLSQDGFFTLVNYSSNEAKAKEVLTEIETRGGTGALLGFNVADSADVDAKIADACEKYGPITVLVNNAGITIDGLLLRLKDEDLDRTLNVDLKGAIFCTRAVAKPMMKARKGSIIQISSVIGEMGNPGQAAYAAAKSGLIGFSKSVAKELGSRNIRVNVVTPGFIETDMTNAMPEAQKTALITNTALQSLGKPDDIANIVSFLALDSSRYITGQVIGVNGGLYM